MANKRRLNEMASYFLNRKGLTTSIQYQLENSRDTIQLPRNWR